MSFLNHWERCLQMYQHSCKSVTRFLILSFFMRQIFLNTFVPLVGCYKMNSFFRTFSWSYLVKEKLSGSQLTNIWRPATALKGTVSQKLRPMLLCIIGKLFLYAFSADLQQIFLLKGQSINSIWKSQRYTNISL